MKEEEWALLDRQALGVVRLLLAKNVAFNVMNEKTTFGLLKALSNMYEKPSASSKVFLIRQLVNMKMRECNWQIIWSDTVIVVKSGTNKLTFKDMRDMILGEDILRRNSREYPNTLLSATGHGRKSNRDVFDDALLCCEEKYYESLVMDSGASFHMTSCMGMMKKFKHLLGNIRLKRILKLCFFASTVSKDPTRKDIMTP
ncbi:hypothetical protein Tco_0718485 [Tanacetum coccineum]